MYRHAINHSPIGQSFSTGVTSIVLAMWSCTKPAALPWFLWRRDLYVMLQNETTFFLKLKRLWDLFYLDLNWNKIFKMSFCTAYHEWSFFRIWENLKNWNSDGIFFSKYSKQCSAWTGINICVLSFFIEIAAENFIYWLSFLYHKEKR